MRNFFREQEFSLSGAMLPAAAIFLTAILPVAAAVGAAKSSKAKQKEQPQAPKWAPFVELVFPFFSSVLDARGLGKDWPTNNLTPRGLILNLGNDCWACFDTELLRMSAIWEGQGVTAVGMAQGSYQRSSAKAPEGQEKLPQIIGTPWLVNGIYPGWQTGAQPVFTDPREPGPDAKEIGRGPLPEKMGQFNAVRLAGRGVYLEYEVNGAKVREWVDSSLKDGERAVQRRFRLENVRGPMWLVLNHRPTADAKGMSRSIAVMGPAVGVTLSTDHDKLATVRVAPSSHPIEFDVVVGKSEAFVGRKSDNATSKLPQARWPQGVTTRGKLSASQEAFVLDDIPLPTSNAQKRNVRFADMGFLPDGRAAVVTFDGDVWIVSGLRDDLREVRWRRFASGLHEPMGLSIRAGEVFVYDRNGIWRLRDTDGNGEADVHELFSNAMAQTAETREFAAGLRLAPDGSFVIAKGGQQGSTLGKQNGTVMRISADGKKADVLGWGLRQPFIGVNPKNGLVTASDQQGHYVPATPLHIIRDRQYYGFLSDQLPKEKYPAPIADPLTWIPHAVNASGAGQVWVTSDRMGPLNDALIHIGYNRPEIFVVLNNARATVPQAAVVSLTGDFGFAPLNGVVNPTDGQLYLTGFQIWGTTAKKISGLARLRYTGAPALLPRAVVPMDQGILLTFDARLDPARAGNPANFTVERWNYRRTASYGSPHYKMDGSAGQEWLTPSSAYVSRDSKSVFVGIPDMKPVMQMRIGWSLAAREGKSFEHNAYFTPFALAKFEPTAEGFEPLTVDLTPRVTQAAATPVTAEEGQKLSALMACIACHATEDTTAPKVGPSWKGLFGKEREFKGGGRVVANEAYLRESITEPTAKIAPGFEKGESGMPSYTGVLTDAQVEALILYIKTLK